MFHLTNIVKHTKVLNGTVFLNEVAFITRNILTRLNVTLSVQWFAFSQSALLKNKVLILW